MTLKARTHFDDLTAYTPGEQRAGGSILKLNTNENPYPPAASVMSAIASVSAEDLRRYPSPLAMPFRRAAAILHDQQLADCDARWGAGTLTQDHIIATNGGDELLRLVITTFCEPAGPDASGGIGYAEPSYSLYPILAATHGTSVAQVPLDDDWSLASDHAAKLNAAGCRVAFIVNPHAPSGRLTELETLQRFANEFLGLLVIDEAYVDFAERSALSLVPSNQNVLLLRSLSKGYGLAGLRFGYGIGSPNIVALLDKARDSYNTDALSQSAAVAALVDQPYASKTWQAVILERQSLTDKLVAMGWDVAPSQANFILATPPKSLSAETVYRQLKSRDILVRWFDSPRLADKLRITIGTPDQSQRLVSVLSELDHH